MSQKILPSTHTVKPVYNDQPRDPKLWPSFTSGRCSEVGRFILLRPKLRLENGGRCRQVVVSSNLTVQKDDNLQHNF
jgi:hypothetical protein